MSTDYDGAKKAIDAKIDTADYYKWVDKNLKDVIGRKGIRKHCLWLETEQDRQRGDQGYGLGCLQILPVNEKNAYLKYFIN